MKDKFLFRYGGETPTIDSLVAEGRRAASDNTAFVHWIGARLIEKFWRSKPEFARTEELGDTVQRDGVYFNGKNDAEFHRQITAKKIPFWKDYSEKTGITDPGELMQRWLNDNGNTAYNFQRTPEEIVAQQYLGRGGGCGEYVAAMTEILRAAGIPTKIVFFLKHHDDQEHDELTRITHGELGTYGHYMGACFIAGKWRLFDLKWQWNPKFEEFYSDARDGLTHLNHRNNDGTTYVTVTNDGIYTPGEEISSPNIGLVYARDLPDGKLNMQAFAQDFERKAHKSEK